MLDFSKRWHIILGARVKENSKLGIISAICWILFFQNVHTIVQYMYIFCVWEWNGKMCRGIPSSILAPSPFPVSLVKNSFFPLSSWPQWHILTYHVHMYAVFPPNMYQYHRPPTWEVDGEEEGNRINPRSLSFLLAWGRSIPHPANCLWSK